MNHDEFNAIVEEQLAQSRDVLVRKGREYANDEDRLHNFKMGAFLTRHTPEQTLWGYLTKHLVSVTDMVESGDYYPEEVWDEKIGDVINYFILLRAQVVETDKQRAKSVVENRLDTISAVSSVMSDPSLSPVSRVMAGMDDVPTQPKHI